MARTRTLVKRRGVWVDPNEKPAKRNVDADQNDGLILALQQAIRKDRRTLYGIARDCGLRYSIVHAFATGIRPNITLRSAGALCRVLNLRLTRTRKGR